MMNLSFGSDSNFNSTSVAQLDAWKIHKVKFDGAEFSEIQGKKDPSVKYEVLKFKFSNEDGSYTESFFGPKPGDEVRKTRKNNKGEDIETPSNVEVTMKTIGHILQNLNPELLKKMSATSFKSFKQFAETIVKYMDSSKGKETNIKLIGDKENKSRSPFCVSVFKNGEEAKVSNNFIGEKLFFTVYELESMNKIQTASPTNMASINKKETDILGNATISNNSNDDDEDGEVLDLDL